MANHIARCASALRLLCVNFYLQLFVNRFIMYLSHVLLNHPVTFLSVSMVPLMPVSTFVPPVPRFELSWECFA